MKKFGSFEMKIKKLEKDLSTLIAGISNRGFFKEC